MVPTIYVGGPLHGQVATAGADGYTLQDLSYEFKYCQIRIKAYKYDKFSTKDFMIAALAVVIARSLLNG